MLFAVRRTTGRRQPGHGHALDPRQVVHVVVDRLQRAGVGVAQHLLETPFHLAREERDAHRLGAVEIRIDAVEHRDHAGDMEAARDHGNAARDEVAREVERARELVRLHADQHDSAGACLLDQLRDAVGADAGVGLVPGMEDDLDLVAEDAPLGAIAGEPVKGCERIRWNDGAPPLDDVAIIVVMRRLDERENEALARAPPRHC
jgi:hypothetical protein